MTEALRDLRMSTDDAVTGFKILKEHENELTDDDKKRIYKEFKKSGVTDLEPAFYRLRCTFRKELIKFYFY